MDTTAIVDGLYARWGASACPIVTCPHEIGKMLAISIGLGAIFNEDAGAERKWINAHHPRLRAKPYFLLLQGRYDEVLDVVNHERNL